MGWIFKSSHANIHICICTHILLKDKDKSRSLYRAKTSREFQLEKKNKTKNNNKQSGSASLVLVGQVIVWWKTYVTSISRITIWKPTTTSPNHCASNKKGMDFGELHLSFHRSINTFDSRKKTYVLVHLWKYVDNLGNNQFCLSIIPPWKEKIHSVAQCSSAWINAFSRSEIHVWHSIHETPLHPHEKAKEIGL